TFAPGSGEQETRTLSVQAGEIVDVAPTTAVTPAAPAPPTLAPPPPPSPLSASPVTRRQTDHPFSPALVIAAGAITLGAGIAAIPLHQHAASLHDQYAPDPARTASDAQAFYDARTLAYVTTGTAIGLAAVTAGLAAWYFLGTSTREVVVTPGGIAGRF
ncbi:MAG TPA: hypothetical protein VIF09_02315, partial [Polyangiaceae bacterium]